MFTLLCCSVFSLCLLQTFGLPTENYFAQNPSDDTTQTGGVISTNINKDYYETKATELNENFDVATSRWTGDRDPDDGGTTQNEPPKEVDISGNLVQTDNEKKRSKELKYSNYEGSDQISEDKNSDGVRFSDKIEIESNSVPPKSRISNYDELEDLCGEEEEEEISVIKTQPTINTNADTINGLREINLEDEAGRDKDKSEQLNTVSFLHTFPSGYNENTESFPTETEDIQKGIIGKSEEQSPTSSEYHDNPTIASSNILQDIPTGTEPHTFHHKIPSGFNDNSQIFPIENEDIQEGTTGKLEEETPTSSADRISSAFHVDATTTSSSDPQNIPTRSAKLSEPNSFSFHHKIPQGLKEKSLATKGEGIHKGTGKFEEENPVSSLDAIDPTTTISQIDNSGSTIKLNKSNPASFLHSTPSDFDEESELLSTETRQTEIIDRLDGQGSIALHGGFASDYGQKQTIYPAGNFATGSGITATLQEQNPPTFFQRNPSSFGTQLTTGEQQFISTNYQGRQQEIPLQFTESNSAHSPEITASGITATEINSRIEQQNSGPVSIPFGVTGVPMVETTTLGTSGVIDTGTEGGKKAIDFDAEGTGRQRGGTAQITESAAFSFRPTGFNEPTAIEYNTVTSNGAVVTQEPILSNLAGGIPSGITPSTTIPTALQGNFATYNGGIPSGVSTESPANTLDLKDVVTNRYNEITTQRHGTVYYPTTPTTTADYLKNSITSGVNPATFTTGAPTNIPHRNLHGQFGTNIPINGIFNQQISALNRNGISPFTTPASNAQFSKNLVPQFNGVNPVTSNGLPYRTTSAPTGIPNISQGFNGPFGSGGSINGFGILKEQIKQNEGLTTIVPTTSTQYFRNPSVNPVSFVPSTYRPTIPHANIPTGSINEFGRFNGQNNYGGVHNNQFNLQTTTPDFRFSGLTGGNLATTTVSPTTLSTTAKTSTSFDVNPSRQYDIFTGIQTTPPPLEVTTVPTLRASPTALAPHPNIELYSRVGDQETTIPFMQKGKVTLPYQVLPPRKDTGVETSTQDDKSVKALFSGQLNFDPASRSNNKGFQFQTVVGGYNIGILTTGSGGKRPPAPERALVPKLIYKKVDDTNFSQGIIDKYTSTSLKINTVNLGSTGSINRLGDNKKTTFFNGLNIYNPSFARFLK